MKVGSPVRAWLRREKARERVALTVLLNNERWLLFEATQKEIVEMQERLRSHHGGCWPAFISHDGETRWFGRDDGDVWRPT